MILPSPLNIRFRSRIVEFAARRRQPTMDAEDRGPREGALVSYGPSWASNFRQAADLVDRILKGAKPGDLPVQQPTKFELVINIKTAKALGVPIPQSLLLRAHEVIQ
jgi:putative ABC transport system substrate-binding protein